MRPLFSVDGVEARSVDAGAAPQVQALFEANPAYFLLTGGEPPGPGLGLEELESRPPEGWPYTAHWSLGFVRPGQGGAADVWLGLALIDTDLLASGVWHIGLFLLATPVHGSGLAPRLYAALEQWAAAQGAGWLRLGVMLGNARAERFWERQGFVELKRRPDIAMGRLRQTVRVMLKPLGAHSVAEHLERVPRDRAGAGNC